MAFNSSQEALCMISPHCAAVGACHFCLATVAIRVDAERIYLYGTSKVCVCVCVLEECYLLHRSYTEDCTTVSFGANRKLLFTLKFTRCHIIKYVCNLDVFLILPLMHKWYSNERKCECMWEQHHHTCISHFSPNELMICVQNIGSRTSVSCVLILDWAFKQLQTITEHFFSRYQWSDVAQNIGYNWGRVPRAV